MDMSHASATHAGLHQELQVDGSTLVDLSLPESNQREQQETNHRIGTFYDLINAGSSNESLEAVNYDHCYLTSHNSSRKVDNLQHGNQKEKIYRRTNIFVDDYDSLLPSTNSKNLGEVIDVDGPSSSERCGRATSAECFDSPEKMHAQSSECYEVARRLRLMLPSTGIASADMLESDSDSDSTSKCPMDDLSRIMHSALHDLSACRSRTLLAQILNLLRSMHQSYLVIEGRHDESILKRNNLNSSAAKLRRCLSYHDWTDDPVQSVHKLLILQLPQKYLAYYLDLLRTTRATIPVLIDHLIQLPSLDRHVIAEIAFFVGRKPWDPAKSLMSKFPPINLPERCHVLLIPPTPKLEANVNLGIARWITIFRLISSIVGIKGSQVNFSPIYRSMSAVEYSTECTKVIRNSIEELRSVAPDHKLIIVAWDSIIPAAIEALQGTPVSALICLAYSNLSLSGRKGDADDRIHLVGCPILFVVGQCSQTCSLYDLEDIRKSLRVPSGLLVVGSSNSQLRMNYSKLIAKSVSQTMVDRCILDTVLQFCSLALKTIVKPLSPGTVWSSLHGHRLLKRKYAADDTTVVDDKEISQAKGVDTNKNQLSKRPVAKAHNPAATTEDSTDLDSSFDWPRTAAPGTGLSATRTRTVKRPKLFDV